MSLPIKGVYAATLTPLTKSLEPNIPELVKHVKWLLKSGSNGVALLGSTGEANSMTIEQRLKIIQESTKQLPQEKLMIGTGSCAIRDSIKLTRASIDEGVFTVLVLPPFYYKPLSDESILRYFSELISNVNESKLRIIFYNFPKLSGFNFSINILRRFKQEFGVIASGIKDSSSDWGNIISLVQNINDFKVYAGTETFLLDTLNIGGAGCISASANLTSIECQKVFQAWSKKQLDIGGKEQNKLSNLRKILENHPFIPELKSLLHNHSNSETWKNMLPPFYPLLSNQILSIENQLKEFGMDLKQCLRKT